MPRLNIACTMASGGEPIVQLLRPDREDYFILKPQQSGFAATPLELMLDHFDAKTVILTGVAAHMCVLFTAVDAYQRGYQICEPRDCVAANTAEDTQHALRVMESGIRARTRAWRELALGSLRKQATS